MKKYIFLTIIITSITSILLYSEFLQKSTRVLINVGGYVRYGAEQTYLGVEPYELSAFGVLKLTKDQPEGVNQIFKIDLIDNKIILNEGLIDDGTIVMSSSEILDIISTSETELVSKNETYTITVTKKSVIITDKYGKGGNLISGFVGNVEYDLISY